MKSNRRDLEEASIPLCVGLAGLVVDNKNEIIRPRADCMSICLCAGEGHIAASGGANDANNVVAVVEIYRRGSKVIGEKAKIAGLRRVCVPSVSKPPRFDWFKPAMFELSLTRGAIIKL